MSSHEMNEVMRTLALVTVLFAPLTVLAGYFVRLAPFSSTVPVDEWCVFAGYELRADVVCSRKIRHLVRWILSAPLELSTYPNSPPLVPASGRLQSR